MALGKRGDTGNIKPGSYVRTRWSTRLWTHRTTVGGGGDGDGDDEQEEDKEGRRKKSFLH